MDISIQAAHPQEDPEVAALLESSFGRSDRELRLARELSVGHPGFDPGLALKAVMEDECAGWMMLLRRGIFLRGLRIPAAVAAPIGVLPPRQEQGVGQKLLQAGEQRLRESAVRAMVTLGAPEFFHSAGFAPAFNLHSIRVPVECLPEEGDTSHWRGLQGPDLEPLRLVQERSYRGINGVEVRTGSALDWECLAERAYTMVHDAGGGPDAYIRFRIRDEFEVTECGATDAAAVDQVLRLLARLCREHSRMALDALLAPPHPLALTFFSLGCLLETSNFGGASLMKVIDWPGLMTDLGPWWIDAVASLPGRELSLEIGGEHLRLGATGEGTMVSLGEPCAQSLWIPPGWEAGLLTGQKCAYDLWLHPEVLERSKLDRDGLRCCAQIFQASPAQWIYAPVYELADD